MVGYESQTFNVHSAGGREMSSIFLIQFVVDFPLEIFCYRVRKVVPRSSIMAQLP